jgi:site-specific recombinase XerD
MIDSFIVHLTVRQRLREGPLGPAVDYIAQTMQAQGYAAATIRIYLRNTAHFGRWLERHHIAVASVTNATVERYLRHCGRLPSGQLPKAVHGLRDLVTLLREQGIIPQQALITPTTECDRWLHRYEHYLRTVQGAAASTRATYLRIARRFLTSCFPTGQVDWPAFKAKHVAAFVQRETALRVGAGRREPAAAVRAALRFVVLSGDRAPGLEGAVPMPRQWLHATLPPQLTQTEVEQVLQSTQGTTPAAIRNHAILLLLARFGLRAREVARLQLDDIQWHASQLMIRPGKAHQERCLPLSQEVGDALVAYLTTTRPVSASRSVFLRLKPPFRPFVRACGIGRLVRRALERAGILPRTPMGAHLFRHTAASRMVQQGATFKEVADVLGHRSLQTTGLYAKLDLANLTAVALPWNGGVQ